MRIIRVAQLTTTILPQLQDVMQQLEENGEDSREVILQVLSDIQDRISCWYWSTLIRYVLKLGSSKAYL